jgi:predicted dehydrogenase
MNPEPPHPLVADPERPLRIAMYGVTHSHAAGKLRALVAHPHVELCGVYEPDEAARGRAQENGAFAGVQWLDSLHQFLDDPTVVAVCLEGPEGRCTNMAQHCIEAGKHLWYDKPAGDLDSFRAVIATAREHRLLVQMGYMLRYNAAFQQLAKWLRTGLLGDLFAVRGHMSTSSKDPASRGGAGHAGGIAFLLAPHMLDQVLWLFGGRPQRVTSFLRNDATPGTPAHADNTLVVLEFEGAGGPGSSGSSAQRGMALIDIAHMEPAPAARRFEVYGTRGSAIVVEPFEPGSVIRLALTEARDGYQLGEQRVEVTPTTRHQAYHHEIAAFVDALRGRKPPDRTLDHELLVEETLHRALRTAFP